MRWRCTLIFLLGCSGSGPSEPLPDARGVVLFSDVDDLVVEHADPLGRVVPGVARYRVDRDWGLTAGQEVDLWISGEHRPRKVVELTIRGKAALPGAHRDGGYPVVGTVVRRDGGKLTVEHEEIEGLMAAMIMPFDVGPDVAPRFAPGDRIEGRLVVSSYGYRLVNVRTVGQGDVALRDDVAPIELGEVLAPLEVPVTGDRSWTLGKDQGVPTALTFIYTRCPDPAFCPAVVSRMQALQERVRGRARILLVTIDPEYDSLSVLGDYATLVGADPSTWAFGALEPAVLNRLAMTSGLSVTVRDGKISHRLRLLILDGEGRLIERYDDNEWPLERVSSQLLDGTPRDATRTGSLYGEEP